MPHPLLASLERDRNQTVTTNFDWQSLPPTWALATSFGTAAPVSSPSGADARCQTTTGPWSRINGALFAAGDFRLHPFHIGRQPAILAVRGTWLFTDDHAAEQIGHTIQLVRDFWHDDAFPFFLVTLQPFDQDHGSSDGTAFTDSFWMYISRKDTINSVILRQLAHEAFHAWDPLKMGSLSAAEYDKTKWFKEGFTEYYAQRLTTEGGVRTPQQLVSTTNQDLLAFPTSHSEYTRGRIIALWLDATIRARSHGRHSLDDVMVRLVQDGAEPLTEKRIVATIRPFLSAQQLTRLRNAADHQGNLPAPPSLPGAGPCFRPVQKDLRAFDLGFDRDASREAHVLAGVDPAGPAFRAGLRNGQPILRIDFNNGDPDRPANITIRQDNQPRTISYLPAANPKLTWQYVPASQPGCPALH